MTSVELGRPLAASLVLGALLSLAGLALGACWADLATAEAERDAKANFVSRSVQGVRRENGTVQPSEPEQLYVPADSETLAAAHVDALVRTMAREAGGTVLSSRADARHDEAGLGGRIEVQAVIEAQNDALQMLLLRMETGAPMVVVDDMAIQPVVSGGPDGVDSVSPKLHAALTLSAYWRGPQK